jgi:glycosyltransferase involved in cell wall biosynthesis
MVGGSHVSALGLIRALDSARYEPLILVHGDAGPLGELLRAEGIKAEPAPIEALSGGTVPALAKMIRHGPGIIYGAAKFLRDRRVRIVHTNEGPMHATWTLPARFAGARHIWHHRGNPHATGLRYVAPFLAHRVICVSRFARPSPGLFSANRKSSVVFSPFDTALPDIDRQAARATVIAAINVPADALILAFVGHFAKRKRPLIFIETIAALRDADPSRPVVGLMFGEEFEPGQQAQVEQSISQLGLTDNVRLMGFRRPIEPWLAGCDLLVVPAVDEPFGRTLIEAMLLGTPVIAAASGGNLEAIRDTETGILAPPDQPDEFAAQIVRLMRNSGLAHSIAARAQTEARASFSIDRHVREITAIYRESLA